MNRSLARRAARVMAALCIVGVALTGCGAKSNSSGTTLKALWGGLGATERATYQYIVPYGTQDRINRGESVTIMPAQLNVKVGESIRIVNEDRKDFVVGPFFLAAQSELAMKFTNPGKLSGTCSMNPEGEFVINVTK